MPYEKDEAKTEPEGLDDTEPEEPKAYATVGQKEQDGKRDASIWKQIFRGESTVQELLAAVWEKIWKTTGTAAGRPADKIAGKLVGGTTGRPTGKRAGKTTGRAAASRDKGRTGRWKISGNMKNAQKEQEPFVFEPEEEEHKCKKVLNIFGVSPNIVANDKHTVLKKVSWKKKSYCKVYG